MLKHFNKNRKRRAGVTILEYLLVGALSIGLLVYAANQYTTGQGQSAAQRAVSDLQTTVANTRSYFSGFGSYTDASNTVGVNARLFAQPMMTAASADNPDTGVLDAWGGVVTLGVAGTNGSQFTIQFTQVPQDACSRLISNNTAGQGSAVAALSVNNKSITLPVTASTATSACSISTNAGNTILWTFY